MSKLMKDLRASLARAFSSGDVSRSLARIREEGWSLYLVVDRRVSGEEPEAFELTPATRTAEPLFKIDSQDLGFLRSVGIDPTRKLRRRRGG